MYFLTLKTFIIIINVVLTLTENNISVSFSRDVDSHKLSSCKHTYTPDQVVRQYEPQFVNCNGRVYEDNLEILTTMCIAVRRNSGSVRTDYANLSNYLCSLWKQRQNCLWTFISDRCKKEEFELISEIRRTNLMVVAKEALCSDKNFTGGMYEFLELGGANCFCSQNDSIIRELEKCTGSIYKYSNFPYDGIPFKQFKDLLLKVKECGTPFLQKCILPIQTAYKSSQPGFDQRVSQAFSLFIDGLIGAQESLWVYRKPEKNSTNSVNFYNN